MARVLRGEDAEAVYNEVGDQLGKSLEGFRLDVSRYEAARARPVEMIDWYLGRDFVAMVRASYER